MDTMKGPESDFEQWLKGQLQGDLDRIHVSTPPLRQVDQPLIRRLTMSFLSMIGAFRFKAALAAAVIVAGATGVGVMASSNPFPPLLGGQFVKSVQSIGQQSKTPKREDSPSPTLAPEPSASPEPTDTPDPSPSPDPTETPDATQSPEPTATPESTNSTDKTGSTDSSKDSSSSTSTSKDS